MNKNLEDKIAMIKDFAVDFLRPNEIEKIAYLGAIPGLIALGIGAYVATQDPEITAIATIGPIPTCYIYNRIRELGGRITKKY